MTHFHDLARQLAGEFYFDDSVEHLAIRKVYATDASVYQELPVAVCLPKGNADLVALTRFVSQHNLTLIPRGAGTSLAGQVVGNGIVVDMSKYFTAIIELNKEEQWVRVQPGVIRDDLNAYLKQSGLMFGPETSTANRAAIGGMIGNNSCGLHSITWGDTRKNLLEVNAILADGKETVFKELDADSLDKKMRGDDLEAEVYRSLHILLSKEENRQAIKTGFPKASIQRRNTGYALDSLLSQQENGRFNIAKLVAGSEGTICFVTEAKLQLQPLPPRERCVVAVHTKTIRQSLEANIIALQHQCAASELVDDIILDYTKTNIDQSRNRFFVEGEPKAILMVEFFDAAVDGLQIRAQQFIAQLNTAGLGYAHPILFGTDCDKAWNLRKAGLGLLRNEPGDTQPVNLIEDCAVDPHDLPDYIDEVEALLKKYALKYSMYAHAGAGELHVEPMINLKTQAGKHLFKTVLAETASIVKKYNGSLSGEHGDGRLRGEFIPFMMGEKNYSLFEEVKNIFDPQHIFNRGKIVNTPPMNEFLRYGQDEPQEQIKTVFDFSGQESILRLAEKCSGSGDCRKTHVSGGTMCPSFMATRSERDTTRARANMLRHFYTQRKDELKMGADEKEVLDILDLCLSCKACKSECPSSVDVAKMKAEFTQSYYDKHGIPLRSKLVGDFSRQMKLASLFPQAYNSLFGTKSIRKIINRLVGFHPNRSMPLLHNTTLRKWFAKRPVRTVTDPTKRVLLFCDEFTNYNDVELGKKTVLLLEALGYTVEIPQHEESGRTWLSKGLVRNAKNVAIKNVLALHEKVSAATPLVGIEPSAILALRDEYPELVPPELQESAKHLAAQVYLFEEWFARELLAGRIDKNAFRQTETVIKLHGHCHQKALSSTLYIKQSLSVLPGCTVEEIPSGCCGMAGSFGYEKEHFGISMSIGELVLFPAVRAAEGAAIAASGTSCRHQLKDGTGVIARHTAEILYAALNAPQLP